MNDDVIGGVLAYLHGMIDPMDPHNPKFAIVRAHISKIQEALSTIEQKKTGLAFRVPVGSLPGHERPRDPIEAAQQDGFPDVYNT